jgi:hypothetical protein
LLDPIKAIKNHCTCPVRIAAVILIISIDALMVPGFDFCVLSSMFFERRDGAFALCPSSLLTTTYYSPHKPHY